MNNVELHISKRDWFYIILLGALFGFFISLFFYYIDENIRYTSTIVFGTVSSVSICIFSSIFITLSNSFILPNISRKFWYVISFAFSFFAGVFGFIFSFFLFLNSQIPIIVLIEPFWNNLALIVGFLTFLIGIILHLFISMKYKNELINKNILEANIKALENELNPHFLFNTLNSISELVHVDQDKAEIAVLNLAKFLRNVIKQGSLIELSKELEMVQTYVNIENIRFEEQINLSINVEEEYLDKLIPKFSLQLLVENAIKHGYDKKALHVKIKSQNKTLVVINDGKECREVIFGTGLSNLNDRLELLGIGKLEYEKNGQKFTIKLMDTK